MDTPCGTSDSAKLQELPLSVIDGHPENPRFLREHVADDIARQLASDGALAWLRSEAEKEGGES